MGQSYAPVLSESQRPSTEDPASGYSLKCTFPGTSGADAQPQLLLVLETQTAVPVNHVKSALTSPLPLSSSTLPSYQNPLTILGSIFGQSALLEKVTTLYRLDPLPCPDVTLRHSQMLTNSCIQPPCFSYDVWFYPQSYKPENANRLCMLFHIQTSTQPKAVCPWSLLLHLLIQSLGAMFLIDWASVTHPFPNLTGSTDSGYLPCGAQGQSQVVPSPQSHTVRNSPNTGKVHRKWQTSLSLSQIFSGHL